jgi:hypothetical protein
MLYLEENYSACLWRAGQPPHLNSLQAVRLIRLNTSSSPCCGASPTTAISVSYPDWMPVRPLPRFRAPKFAQGHCSVVETSMMAYRCLQLPRLPASRARSISKCLTSGPSINIETRCFFDPDLRAYRRSKSDADLIRFFRETCLHIDRACP